VSKKKLSVGVKAAWIGAFALITAALVPFLLHIEEKPGQSVSNGNGNVQAGHDVNIQNNGDVDTGKKYDDEFENMAAKRSSAGIVCLEYLSKTNWDLVTNDTDGLDDVLGFFNLLGYAMEKQEISSNDVYEYFCDDILAYYQTSKGYIDKIQKDDPTELVHLKPLYDIMRIEAAAQPPVTTPDQIYFIKPELRKIFKSETNSINLTR